MHHHRAGGPTRHNFTLNVLDGAVYAFGAALVSRQTVLPLFVERIGGDNVAVALLPVIWTIGFNMPQILIANYARQAPDRWRLFLLTGFGQRFPWLLLALLAWFVLGRVSTGVGLTLFFTGFGLAALMGSMHLPVWFDVVARLTPVRLRGRLFAVRLASSGVLGVLAGSVAALVLGTWPYPQSFALLMAVAFVAMIASLAFLTLLRDDTPVEPAPPLRYRAFLRGLPAILRRERNYRNYLIADALLITAGVAEAFYTLHAFRRFDLSPDFAGRFTVVMMVGTVAGSLLFGYLADRLGHRVNLVLAGVCTAAACLVAVTATTVAAYLFVFVAAAFVIALQNISRLNIVAELCGERDRGTYVALVNLLTAPFALAGLGMGWAANHFGYEPVFLVLGGVASAAVVWLVTMVREPRGGHAA